MSYSEELKKIRKNVFCLKKLLGEKWGVLFINKALERRKK